MNNDSIPRIALLASGSGTNLQALIDATINSEIHGRIVSVYSDRSNARALDRARAHNINAQHIEIGPTGGSNYDDELIQSVADCRPDLIVLAGYMRILSSRFVKRFGQQTINLHPSLLPKYKGINTHQRVITAADTQHGATVHFVTEGLDDGPSIMQYRFDVSPDDNPQTLSARVHRAEHIILPKTVMWFCEGRLRLVGDQVMLDGNTLASPVIFEDPIENA